MAFNESIVDVSKYMDVIEQIESLKYLSAQEKERAVRRILSKPFVDLRNDWAFKTVLMKNKDILTMLLNDILPVRIVDLDVLPQELLPDRMDDRYVVFDIFCQTESGKRIVVEMQRKVGNDLRNRMFYYGSGLIYNQMERGEKVYDLESVYVLLFLDGKMIHDESSPEDKFIYRYRMAEEETHEIYGDLMSIFICEMARLDLDAPVITDPIEQWVYYFQKMATFALDSPKVLDERFQPLIAASRVGRMTDDERKNYLKSMLTEEEKRNYAVANYEIGHHDGYKKGKAEGREEGKTEVALAMLSEGFPLDVIIRVTGLTEKEILSSPEEVIL